MLRIPNYVLDNYVAYLIKRKIPQDRFDEYKKWLRYFLDFRDKYPVTANKGVQVRLFCEKLKDKKQSEKQRERAALAVSLYLEMQTATPKVAEEYPVDEVSPVSVRKEDKCDNAPSVPKNPAPVPLAGASSQNFYYLSEVAPQYSTYASRTSQYTEAGYQVKSASPEWDGSGIPGTAYSIHLNPKTTKSRPISIC